MMEDQVSAYKYRIGKLLKPRSISDNRIDCFFIRRANWFKIKHNEELTHIVRGYRVKTIKNYLRRVHIPIRKEQHLVHTFNIE